LALRAYNVDQLHDIGVFGELFENFDLTDGRDGEAIIRCRLDFDLLEGIELVANLGAINLTERTLANKFFFFENLGRA